jgi:hypothetical protein
MKNKSGHHLTPLPAAPRAGTPVIWGYGVGAALIAFGLLVLAIALGSSLRSATRGIHRLQFPGTQRLEMKEGFYVGVFRPAKEEEPVPAGLTVEVTDESGAPVPVAEVPEALRPNTPKDGIPLFQVQVPFDGPHRVTGRTASGAAEIYLIHQSVARNPSDLIVGAVLFLVLGGFGVFMLILTYRRGRRPTIPGK